jgi:hypothetical protein
LPWRESPSPPMTGGIDRPARPVADWSKRRRPFKDHGALMRIEGALMAYYRSLSRLTT